MNNKKYKDTFYEFRYINDLKDMLNSSAELFAKRPAYLIKDRPGGEYRPVLYEQVKKDVDALGTRLTDLGLKGRKIAVMGENSYKWIVSYLAVANGTGVVVPLDRELPPKEISNLIKRAGVSAVIYSEKVESTINDALKECSEVEYRISMTAQEHKAGILSFDRLIEEGAAAILQGDRRFLDAPIDREAMCTLLFTSGTTGLAKGVIDVYKRQEYRTI